MQAAALGQSTQLSNTVTIYQHRSLTDTIRAPSAAPGTVPSQSPLRFRHSLHSLTSPLPLTTSPPSFEVHSTHHTSHERRFCS